MSRMYGVLRLNQASGNYGFEIQRPTPLDGAVPILSPGAPWRRVATLEYTVVDKRT